MPVKMISTRRCYIPSSLREVGPNTEFNAADEREAKRLTRQKRAKVVEESKSTTQAAPAARRKTLSLRDDAQSQADAKAPGAAAGTYSRRDMRATEGQ
jgi:hypothetical protein